ncbi:MAG: patatin-like phospholipase family protein [Xanthomonadales bacterium]|nr:patatin-like phospholipase family protein [Xanthomonadales bacterium]
MTQAATETLIQAQNLTALVLPGGGARSAYQVGVLKAIVELRGDKPNPFPLMCGVSAGAINAAVMASHAHEFSHGVARLEQFWSSMSCERIYRTDGWTVLSTGLRWMGSLTLGGRLINNPRSLLDNEPLRQLLQANLQLDGVETAIDTGNLRAVAITASGYRSASAVSFFQGCRDLEGWKFPRREGRPTRIEAGHLLASAALPLIFPAEKIGAEYFGDGGMRMLSPLSPAINLGATKVLVIGTRDERPDPAPQRDMLYPSLGEIGGYLLDCIFMDTLTSDLQRLARNNQVISRIPAEQRSELAMRKINSLVIRPSRDLRDLTREHVAEIPSSVRLLLRSLGGWGRDWRLASYLLFGPTYCQALMALGYKDGMQQAEALKAFLD